MLHCAGSEAGAGGAGVILPDDAGKLAYSSMGEVAGQFTATLPARPYCSDDLSAGVYIRPQDEALRAKYLQWNQRHRVAWLPFDIDTPEAGAAWIDGDAPPPNVIVMNPKNGHAKIGYALAVPVTTSYKGRKAPREMLERLEVNLTRALGADPSFSGARAVTNNPFHPAWVLRSLTSRPYTLGELLEAVPGPITRPDKGELVGEGRNVTIFHELRQWAYPLARAARHAGNELTWTQAVRAQAHAVNARFSFPLRAREVDAIAASVGRFAWNNAHNFKASKIGGVKRSLVESKDREAMTAEQARERMSEGRAYSAQVQRDTTRERIIQAVGELVRAGNMNPSKSQIAELAGVGVATVARYRASLNTNGGGN